MNRLLIAGCGDLGTRVGLRCLAQGWAVVGLRRSRVELPFETVCADLVRPFAIEPDFSHVVIALTPDARDEASYRRTYLDAVANLRFAGTPRVLFVSSTSVWGDHDGAVVDEDTPARPDAFSGRVLAEAESRIDGIILRLAGLYGPARTSLVARVRNRHPMSDEWTNRIHVDDAAAAIVHLLSIKAPQRIYVGVDREPARLHDVADFIAARLGVPPCPRIRGAQNKRLSCDRLRASGFEPAYPDFRSGYAALV